MARLNGWSAVDTFENFVLPRSGARLHGMVTDHPVLGPEGNRRGVYTSPVVSLDLVSSVAVTTSGTRYELGDPAPGYVAWLAQHWNVTLEQLRTWVPAPTEPLKEGN